MYHSKIYRIVDFLKTEIAPYLGADKKPILKQLREMIAYYRHYRYIPIAYIKHGLYKRDNTDNILDFIPAKWMEFERDAINSNGEPIFFQDKHKFFEKFLGTVPVVPTRYIVSRGGVIKKYIPYTGTTAVEELAEWGKTEPFVFVKPRYGATGFAAQKVAIADIVQCKNNNERDDFFFAGITDPTADEFLIQPCIKQHKALNAICAGSVNTVRIDTLVKAGRLYINAAVLRVGNGMTDVDNWAAGGCIAKIDVDTGMVTGHGRIKSKYGGGMVERHPHTRHVFHGTQIPFWETVLEYANQAALFSARRFDIHSVGWDIAITDTGPVFIEGNHDYDVFLSQEAHRGYAHTALGRHVLHARQVSCP